MSETRLEALREVYRIAKEAIDDRVERLEARGSVTREAVEPPPMEIGEDPIDQVLDRLLDLRPTIHPHMHGGYVWSACLRCDLVDVKVDEEGCCVVCGEDATFVGLEPESDSSTPTDSAPDSYWIRELERVLIETSHYEETPMRDHFHREIRQIIASAPTDSAVPEPADPPTEGPKVVGYVSEAFIAGELSHGGITPRPNTIQEVPVILQSEHEEVVRGLRERVRKVEEEGIGCRDCDDKGWNEDRAGRYACACVEETEVWQDLKAENERLTEAATRTEGILAAIPDDGQMTIHVRELNKIVGNAWLDGFAYATGPTPSDSTETEQDDFEKYADEKVQEIARIMDGTEADEGSVEGEVALHRFDGGYDLSRVILPDGPFPSHLTPGTRVRITKLPQTGGNDGDE